MWKTGVKELLDNTDVQDPTDFPPSSTVPGLRALDSALRCNICQELYEAPVVLTCGHCFCSLCARSQLGEKPTCPTCWKETTTSSFRTNPEMEEAVTAWKDARPFVLRLVNEALDAQIKTSESLRPSKRRKPNSHSGDVILSLAPPRSGQTGAPTPSKECPSLDVGTSGDGPEQDTRSGSEPPTNDSSVECPVCAKRVPMAKINGHLDSNCRSYVSNGKTASSSRSGQKDAWSKLLDGKKSGKEREKPDAELDTPLPKASYAILKERQIRDLLAENDLPTTGDRSQLIARHERWVSVYNANLDRSPALRKRLVELRAEMRRWEEERQRLRKEPLKTDVAEYRRANKAEFDKLVQLARPKPSSHSEIPKPRRGSAMPAVSSAQLVVVCEGNRDGDDRGEMDRRLRRSQVSSGGEIDAIIVDSDPER